MRNYLLTTMIKRIKIAIMALWIAFAASAVFSPPEAAASCRLSHDGATAVTVKDSVTIYFSLDCTDILPYLKQNEGMMDGFMAALNEAWTSGRLKTVEIRAFSCLIGTEANCRKVADRRADNLASYIAGQSGIPKETISIAETDIAWDKLYDMVSRDSSMPGKDDVLKIIKETPVFIYDNDGKIIDGRKNRLMEVGEGEAFRYMRDGFFPEMRYASALILTEEPVEAAKEEPARQEPAVEQEPVIEEEVPAIEEEPVVREEPVAAEEIIEPEIFDSKVLIKTNIPYWGLVVPNLAVEIKLADHWSLDIPVFYSPFTVADNYRFRTFTLQPGVRYWLKPQMKGHFFGVHVTGGMYNISVDKKYRYQDTDGVWGAGIDYGYALEFSKHWGMEFNIGVGYLWTKYQTYYNIENGAPCGISTHNYLGVTRLGISLIYKL